MSSWEREEHGKDAEVGKACRVEMKADGHGNRILENEEEGGMG